MKLERLRQILDRASGKRIAVAGDLMLDEFVSGKSADGFRRKRPCRWWK